MILWSFCARAQDLTYCGTGYFIDLSIGYTPTAVGLELCGCSEEVNHCELVHIIMRRTMSDGSVSLQDCPDIVLTERWWREKKDLIDIYYAETCIELEESPTHNDRYEINTSNYDAGDTLSILVCKNDITDPNLIELSASPGQACSEFVCAPKMNCPVEMRLHPDLACEYILPDFTIDVILEDTCQIPPLDVTEDFVIMQFPPPGSVVTEDLFVEIKIGNVEGEVVSTCDISVIVVNNSPPILSDPIPILDIRAGDPFPIFENLIATDSIIGGEILTIETVQTIDPYIEEACLGYDVTYRWIAIDACGLSVETSQSFSVLPNDDGPIFASLPVDIDTIRVGEALPLLVDLIAVNPDGTLDGITMLSAIDAYEEDNCFGYDITYRWEAIDSCGDITMITETFYVEPNGQPPVFVNLPDDLPDINTSDSLPRHQTLLALSAEGDSIGIEVIASVDSFDVDPCNPYEITYRWTALDSCGLSTSVTQTFSVRPDTLSGFLLAGDSDMMIEVALDCRQSIEIDLPIDLGLNPDITVLVIITDGDWNVIGEYPYTGPEEYDFGTGDSHLIYIVSNLCNREVRDTINVQASDVSAPIFVCPEQQELTLTDFSTCSTTADWTLPEVFDNCSDVDLVQTSGPTLGGIIGVGTYEIGYDATDMSGNTSSCSFQLIVSPFSSSSLTCLPLTIELDSICEAYTTKEAIIGLDLLICAPNLEVEIIIGSDTLRGDSFQLGPFYGQDIAYIICEPLLDICCENSIYLVDSIGPIVTCIDTITISCLSSLEGYLPDVSLDCGPITWQIRDLDNISICDDLYIQSQIIREFVAIDLAGNASQPCTTVINIAYANIDSLFNNGLLHLPKDTTISCEEHDIGSISTILFGQPILDSLPLMVGEDICGITTQYEDEPFLNYGCTRIIRRHWKISEGICGYQSREIEGVQIIKIIDTVGPIIKPLVGVIHVFTSVDDCIGLLKMPQIEITDNCQDQDQLFYAFKDEGDIYNIGDSIALSLGIHELTVVAEDGCDNKSYSSITVEVIDNIRPVAACLEHTTISITADGIKYPLSALDIGSYDNCQIVSIQIKKTKMSCSDQDTVYGDFIRFCCSDAGQSVEIRLRTIDHAGNENFCWGIVDVQEKVAPIISCPPDLILDCALGFSKSETEGDPYGHIFGRIRSLEERGPLPILSEWIIQYNGDLMDGIVSDNCDNIPDIIVETTEDINDCGIGFLYRSFTAIDQSGNRSNSCTQVIEIRPSEGIDTFSIIWPQEEIFIQKCTADNAISPDELGRPRIENKVCAMFGISYKDTYVDFTESNNSVCSKIIRTWTIIDWCEALPFENTLTMDQVIKISDLDDPIIDSCKDDELLFAEIINDCGDIPITLYKGAHDNCTNPDQLRWSVKIDYFVDGSVNFDEIIVPDTLGALITTNTPIGRHKVTWFVQDKCGNISNCVEFINVENAKPPTPIAHGISTTLTTEEKVVIWADDLISKIDHPCYQDGIASISREDEDFVHATHKLEFNCDDIGLNVIKVYASRTLPNGSAAFDFVTVIVDIEDTNNICPNDGQEEHEPGKVAGLVYTDDGRLVPGVQLQLRRVLSEEVMMEGQSDNKGYYNLGILPQSGTHYLSANLEGDVDDGLTTLDVILIQRHILGTSVFESPFKIITADVNRDTRVSVTDMLDMRRVILGISSTFPKSLAWRFIDADFPFFDDRYPLDDKPTEEVFVRYLDAQANIVAMKVGDVNGSAQILKTDVADNRSIEMINIQNTSFRKNEDVIIDLNAGSSWNTYGYQLAISYDKDRLTFQSLEDNTTGMDIEYNLDDQGIIYISSISKTPIQFDSHDQLLQLRFRAIDDGNIKRSLTIDNKAMQAEKYNQDLIAQNLQFSFIETSHKFEISQNTPNPFSDQSEILVTIPKSSTILLEVFNVGGIKIMERQLNLLEGTNSILIDQEDLGGSGVYYYKVLYGEESIIKRMILLR